MSSHKATPEDIEADIARQRDELAATVSELQYRLDVKSRGKEKAVELSRSPAVRAGAALALLTAVGLVVCCIRSNH